MFFVCPGRSVILNCSVEIPRSSIQWRIWCECSADSSGVCWKTCMQAAIVNSDDGVQYGTVCSSSTEHTSTAITYEHNFTAVRDHNNDTLVPSSTLDVAFPLDVQQSSTRLCLECNSQHHGYLQVPGS